MFTRLMEYRAVLGVTPALLDGLDELGVSYPDAFAGVAVVGARPGAYERLAGAGCAPHHFVLCGPAVAIAREPGGPAFVNDDEWELGLEGDQIVVTAKRPRATPFDRAPTGVRGALVNGGVLPTSVKEER
jgi:hypothetical protein